MSLRVNTTEKTHAPDGSLTLSEQARRHQVFLDSQPATARCAHCPDFVVETTAGEVVAIAAAHRAEAHPEFVAQGRGRRKTKAENRREANQRRAEREDAERLAKIEAGRQRDLLERMDAGEPLGEQTPGERALAEFQEQRELELEEASPSTGPDDASSSPTATEQLLARNEERRAAAHHDQEEPMDAFEARRKRRKPYTREEVETALCRFHDEHNRPPSISDIKTTAYLPSVAGAVNGFGVKVWADVIEAMGWPRPTTNSRPGRATAAPAASPQPEPAPEPSTELETTAAPMHASPLVRLLSQLPAEDLEAAHAELEHAMRRIQAEHLVIAEALTTKAA